MKPSWRRIRRAAVATAMAIAVTALPTTVSATPQNAPAPPEAPQAAAAASSGWNDFSCTPSAAHPRAVVLVHGTGGNAVDNWLGLAPYLVNRGYCVFSLDYGSLDGVPLFYGLGPVEESAQELAAFVDRVLAATGTDEVDIVGHSQGGMMPRYYLKFLGGADSVNALVGIAPSNHGTTLHGIAELVDLVPGLEDALQGTAPALAQQVAGSDLLQRLNAGGDTVPGVEYTVIATRYDEVVTPYRTQFLEGPHVTNILVQDRCPFDISAHLTIALVDRVTFHETANALDPAHATPATCFS